MLTNNLIKFHNLNLDNQFFTSIMRHPEIVGLAPEDLEGMTEQRRAELIVGEYLFLLWQHVGRLSSELMFKAQWEYETPEWYDHRHHILHPERWFTDYWTESADNVLRVLPYKGSVLNLCSGDGFYDYYFFRKRASLVECIDFDEKVVKHARRLHSADNITFTTCSILDFEPRESFYDVVVIRGAIEHFNADQQQVIMRKAYQALKPGGWFCGDTPAKAEKGKHLPMHEYEWADEAEMRRELGKVFEHIETRTYPSDAITTMFWRCRK